MFIRIGYKIIQLYVFRSDLASDDIATYCKGILNETLRTKLTNFRLPQYGSLPQPHDSCLHNSISTPCCRKKLIIQYDNQIRQNRIESLSSTVNLPIYPSSKDWWRYMWASEHLSQSFLLVTPCNHPQQVSKWLYKHSCGKEREDFEEK